MIDSIDRNHPTRVAIDGVDAAGKTTLANELAQVLGSMGRSVIRATVDGFHNPAALRHRRGRTSPEGYFDDSFDYPGLVSALLEPLGPGGSRIYRSAIFDYRVDAAINTTPETASPNCILLFDGVFLLRPELRAHWDFSIFLRADFETTIGRAEQRDRQLFGTPEAVRERYTQRYVPAQRMYLDRVQPERWASVVIDNNDPKSPELVHRRGEEL